jgi:hypothetical protein
MVERNPHDCGASAFPRREAPRRGLHARRVLRDDEAVATDPPRQLPVSRGIVAVDPQPSTATVTHPTRLERAAMRLAVVAEPHWRGVRERLPDDGSRDKTGEVTYFCPRRARAASQRAVYRRYRGERFSRCSARSSSLPVDRLSRLSARSCRPTSRGKLLSSRFTASITAVYRTFSVDRRLTGPCPSMRSLTSPVSVRQLGLQVTTSCSQQSCTAPRTSVT